MAHAANLSEDRAAMKTILSAIAMSILISTAGMAQSGPLPASTRAGIDAGNQAWIAGVKTGNTSLIVDTYAENAVDCGPTGHCLRGRLQIAQHLKQQLAANGRAHSAAVDSWGTSQHGSFVYEWGQAEAAFDDGKQLAERYLTVWQLQKDGSWKIFRNMVIPDK